MASNEWLVRKLHEQDKKIEALSRGGTGVGHSSIAPGENLTVISDNGEVVLGAGGVEHVDGPTPATPSAPTLKLGFGTIETTWDGSFAEGEDEDGVPLTAPVDFDVVEVHCSTDPEEEEWGEDTMRGQIKTREGGTITVGGFDVDDEVFVCLVALAKTGKRSAPSATASLTIEGLDFSQLFTEIDAANATIKNAGEVLVTEQDTLNDKLSDAFGQIGDAVASANGKNVVHYQNRRPTSADAGTDGDTWFMGRDSNLAPPIASVPSPWTLSGGSYVIDWALAKDGKGVRFPAESAGALYGPLVPTSPGEVWQASVYAGRYSGSTATANLRVYFYTAGSAYISSVVVSSIGSGAGSYSGSAVAPANAAFARYGLVTSAGGTGWVSACDFAGSLSGLSDKWNVTEQYRHDGTSWVRVELSHTVLSSLDVGKLVAGSAAIKEAVVQKLWAEVVVTKMAVAEQFIGENAILTGAVTAPKITASEELWAKIAQFVKIRAEHIEADAIDGMVVTGATIRTSGGSGEWSDAGLRINAPSGESLVNFPTNGEPLSLNADSTTIRSASISELEAGDTSLTTGSTLTLEAGQLAYPRAPEVRADWYPSAAFTRPDVEYPHDWLGLAAWGDKWVRTVNVLGSAGESLDSIEVYDSDGIHEKTIYLDINPRHGVAVVGDVAYVMGPDKIARPGPEKNWVHGFNLNTGNRVTRWEFTRNVTNRFGMGTDGTNLVFAAVGASGPLYVTRFNPTGGASAGPDLITTDWVKYTNDVEGVAISGNILWVSHREAVRKFTISGSTITYTGTGWVNPNKNGSGIDMSKGWPFVVTSSGNLFEGSVFTSDPTIVEAGVTFRDNAGHETDMSQTSTVSLSPRECAAVSVPSRPNLTTRVYYRQGVGQWQWWDATEGAKRFWVDFIPGTSVADPPSSNTFPNSDPSVVQAAAGPFVVRGDGSGRWGPLTFNADGTMTSTAIPAWVPVTTFQTGYGAQTWGFAPAYRIWPDGKVEWRGVVAMNGTPATGNNMTTGTSDVLTVPVAARPTLAVNLAAASTAGGSNLRRVEFSSSAAPTMLRVYVGDSPGTWVSLDGLSYYKS